MDGSYTKSIRRFVHERRFVHISRVRNILCKKCHVYGTTCVRNVFFHVRSVLNSVYESSRYVRNVPVCETSRVRSVWNPVYIPFLSIYHNHFPQALLFYLKVCNQKFLHSTNLNSSSLAIKEQTIFVILYANV